MKNAERELISQNGELLKNIFNDINAFMPALTKVKDAYALLQLTTKFNDSIFKELITDGIGRIVQVYNDELNSQLDKSGITNQNLRAAALRNTDEPLTALRTAVQELKEVNPVPSYVYNARNEVLSLEFISFSNDSFLITDADKEAIAERYCRVYLEDEVDHETYNVLVDLQKSLMAFEKMKTQKGLPQNTFGSFGQRISDFFNQDGEINPSSIKWANEYKATVDALNAASVKRRQATA
jgi:hypothetical protein